MEVTGEKREFADELGDLLKKHGCVAVPKQRTVAAVDIELADERYREMTPEDRKKHKDECILAANNLLNSERWKGKFGVAPQFTYFGENMKPDVIIVELEAPKADAEKTADSA